MQRRAKQTLMTLDNCYLTWNIYVKSYSLSGLELSIQNVKHTWRCHNVDLYKNYALFQSPNYFIRTCNVFSKFTSGDESQILPKLQVKRTKFKDYFLKGRNKLSSLIEHTHVTFCLSLYSYKIRQQEEMGREGFLL